MLLVRPVTGQHTVSRVVLRRFTVRGVLTIYDGHREIFLNKGPSAGFKMAFDPHDPFRAEALWQSIETRIPTMYAALDARSAVGDPEAEGIIRGVLALHWARSAAIKEAHERVTAEVTTASIANLATQQGLLQRGLHQATGLHAAGPDALDWYNRDVHSRVAEAGREQWLSDRNEHHLAEAQRVIGEWPAQVGYAPFGSDLIISDAPVITHSHQTGGLGPHQWVALADADEIVMPVSPAVVIAVGPKPETIELIPDAVTRYNAMQEHARLRWLGCRPGGASDRRLRSSLPIRALRAD